jgi:Mrp family chromosome partitioning ATPase/predicted Fe-Mo cluster-binding NifX family protein
MSGDVKKPACGSTACSGSCDDGDCRLRACLAGIRKKIVVMSGKGGVGKSTVAVNLAVALALAGKKVGLLDVDIHGPSVPKMLNLEHAEPAMHGENLLPITVGELKVMSIGFLLRDRDDAVIWRGPAKAGVIRQFLTEVEWGDLDVLVIDSPPGTGDELLSVCQLIPDAAGAVVVTTPQEVAAADVRKSINFCQKLGLPVIGIIENMSGFVCPKCGEITEIFVPGGGARIAEQYGLRLLGRIPIDPAIGRSGDEGTPFMHRFADSATAAAFQPILEPIFAMLGDEPESNTSTQGESIMKIAIPTAAGELCLHFGHCESFTIIDANPAARRILAVTQLTPPPHEPGLLPRWMAEQGVNLVIAGGMGKRAQDLFAEKNIAVVTGAPVGAPEKLAADYLAGALVTGGNTCDH